MEATRASFLHALTAAAAAPAPQGRSSVPASGPLLREVPRASRVHYLSVTNFSYSSWRLALPLGMAIQ